MASVAHCINYDELKQFAAAVTLPSGSVAKRLVNFSVYEVCRRHGDPFPH